MELNEGKKGKTWTYGKKKNIRGPTAAALQHHPEKFSKKACKKGGDGDKLCPYAIFSAMAKKGKVHTKYKDQPTTSKKPVKKKKEKKKLKENSFAKYIAERNPTLLEELDIEKLRQERNQLNREIAILQQSGAAVPSWMKKKAKQLKSQTKPK